MCCPADAREARQGPVRRLWFFTFYAAGCASLATATGYAGYGPAGSLLVPHAVQVVLGLLMVFVVPGLSLGCAAFPERQPVVERLLASMGISVAAATCAAMLLAATPIGLSRQLLGELLGGVVIALSLGGLYRSRLAAVALELRAWLKKQSIIEQHKARMPKNSVKRQPDMETDIRRSVVVLRFPFGSGPDEPKA